MERLFIGGHADGRRITVLSDSHPYRIPYIGNVRAGQDFYHPYRLPADNEQEFVVYVHNDITLSAAMQKLIDGYQGASSLNAAGHKPWCMKVPREFDAAMERDYSNAKCDCGAE